jgi:hypothetical protein
MPSFRFGTRLALIGVSPKYKSIAEDRRPWYKVNATTEVAVKLSPVTGRGGP